MLQSAVLTRTEYTFGQCFGPVSRVVQRAKELGFERPIICDSTTFGHIPFFKETTKAGLKPIFGAEVKLGQQNHALRVLARTARGLEELYRVARGVPSGHQFSDQVIVMPFTSPLDSFQAPHTFVDLTPGAVFLNRQRESSGFPTVLVSDVRYPAPTDRKYAELLGVRLGPNLQHWLAPDELASSVQAESWNRIADLCDEVKLPVAENIKVEGDLEALARKGIFWRFPDGWSAHYEDRLQRELGVITEKSYESYFLLVNDLIQWSRARMLVGPGRGSSAGSIVCYLLGITELDPIRHGLLFERFVDVTRVDLPDIDMDFPSDRRDELFVYLQEKYGSSNVARLGNVNRLKPRSILGLVGKRMHIPAYETKDIRDNMIERSTGDSRAAFCLEDTLETLKAGRELLERHPGFRHATQLEGHASHAGVHAAGVIICNTPVTDYCAVDEKGVAQIDKYQAESLNLMKLDALGLKTLDVVQEALDMTGGKITDIDIEAPEIYSLINSQKLTGIFQLEGDAARQLTRQFKLENFNDIVAVSALARPGPLQSGGAKLFLDVRNGKATPEYHHEIHRLWTEQTEGVVVYQEQILFLGRDMGDLGWPELTALRRAMSKSLGKEYFDQFRDKFMAGASTKGVPKEAASKVWDSMMHAGAYAFVKAHSASYSVITAWTAWLKARHPLEFACASLHHTKDDDGILKLLRELTSEGFKYVPFDKNKSAASWSVADGAIVGGLQGVFGIGPKMAEKIVASRAGGLKLTPAILAKLEAPKLKWGDPYPIEAKFKDWYNNPRSHGIKEGWSFTRCNDIESDGKERLVLGQLTEKNLRDALETANIAKKGGVITDFDRTHRYWLNITIKDDTGLLIATVNRKIYNRIGKEILESVPVGSTLMLRGRTGENGIRKLYVEKWKIIG